MAQTLSKTGITTGETVKTGHVTQSIDAFTGTEAYDITLSGSFTMSGGSITGVAGVTNSLTSSYAVTSSHALNTDPFPYTGSVGILGATTINGALTATGGTNSFSGSRGVVLPTSVIGPASVELNLNFTDQKYGGHTHADLSGANDMTLALPTADDAYYGYEWTIGIIATGGTPGSFIISNGSSKIYGTIAAHTSPLNLSGVSTLTIDSNGNVAVGDSLNIRSIGDLGWIVTGTFFKGDAIVAS